VDEQCVLYEWATGDEYCDGGTGMCVSECEWEWWVEFGELFGRSERYGLCYGDCVSYCLRPVEIDSKSR